MKKVVRTQPFILVLMTITSLAGFFLRYYQLTYELQANGSLADGSVTHIILGILLAVFAVALIACLVPLPAANSWKNVFSNNLLPNAAQLFSALGLIAGNMLLLGEKPEIVAGVSQIPEAMSVLLPLLGLLSAFCILLFALQCLRHRKPSPLLYMVASIYLVVRLVLSFQAWSTDPSIYDYCFRLVAAICCMLGAFQLAGFSFDRGKRRTTLFWTICATVFCMISLADTLHSTPDDLLIHLSLTLSMLTSSIQLLFAKSQQEASE